MQRSFFTLLASIALPLAATSVTLDDITAALAGSKCWQSTVDYSVSMPQMLDDIIYRLDLTSIEAPADTLAPCSYLIDWRLDTDGKLTSTGFSAYDNGHHYRYTSGRKLQEYHFDWDSIPFIPRLAGSSKAVAVQKAARFSELLPQMLAEQLRKMQSEPDYQFTLHQDTVVGSHRGCVVVDMRRTIGDSREIAQEGEFVFDGSTLMPLRVSFENNPGSIGEQTVVAVYNPVASPDCTAPTEEVLAERYPEVFEQWRESNYRIETLPGHRLPEFALQDLQGNRFEHATADALAAPTVLVVFDPADSFTAATIADVREALAQLPISADAIYASLSSNIDQIEEAIPEQLPGERRLMGARGLARDCGVASTPTIIVADRAGNVTDVIVGYTPDLRTNLVQRMSLLK